MYPGPFDSAVICFLSETDRWLMDSDLLKVEFVPKTEADR